MEWLTYLLKVTACTVLFFGFYLVVLRKLTFFKINRFYLLATLLLSFIIPALQFEVKREITAVETEAPVNIPEIKPATQAPVQLIQPIMVKYQPEVRPKINWMMLLYFVYGGTAALLLLACLWRLFDLLKHTGSYTQNSDGLKLITKTAGFTNCSFFNYVFINDEDLSATDLSVLLKHEQVHASQYHSIDKIILMVFKAVLWFNPVIYMYDKALEQVHEYEADEITSTDYGNEPYANLLLKLAISKIDMPLIHNFVKSPIKARIKMLFNQKSGNMKKLVYILALPILLGLVYGFTVKYVDVALSNKVENKRLHLDYPNGKWIKGTVVETSKDLESSFFTLKTIDKIYTISSKFVDIKIKIGDELNVFIVPNVIPPPLIGEPDRFKKFENTYMPKAIKNMDGNILFEYEDYHTWRKSAKYANLLSEANKIRGKKLNGIIEQVHYFGAAKIADGILLKVDGNYYRVYIEPKIMKTLTLKPGENFGVIADKVDVWQNSKYPVVIVEPKKLKVTKVKTKIKEKPLQLIGSDKLKDNAKILGPVVPKIISFSKITGDVQHKVSYMENAVIDIMNCRLEAEYVELDQLNGKMIAKNAVLKANEGGSATAKTIVFNLKNGNFNAESGSRTFKVLKVRDTDQQLLKSMRGSLTKADNKVKTNVSYSARDSVKMSKDKSIVTLYGKVKLDSKNFSISADEATYNRNTEKITAKSLTLRNKVTGITMLGSYGEFDINGKAEVWQVNK